MSAHLGVSASILAAVLLFSTPAAAQEGNLDALQTRLDTVSQDFVRTMGQASDLQLDPATSEAAIARNLDRIRTAQQTLATLQARAAEVDALSERLGYDRAEGWAVRQLNQRIRAVDGLLNLQSQRLDLARNPNFAVSLPETSEVGPPGSDNPGEWHSGFQLGCYTDGDTQFELAQVSEQEMWVRHQGQSGFFETVPLAHYLLSAGPESRHTFQGDIYKFAFERPAYFSDPPNEFVWFDDEANIREGWTVWTTGGRC